MRPERQDMPSQERSIKDRGAELYDDPPAATGQPATRPFADYLRETPADPISTGMRAFLWVAGVVVAILLLAALWRAQQPRAARRPRANRPPAAAARPAPGGPLLSATAPPAGR
ncbi:hypothetical protein OJF2_42090 [Aquisphaera giovannonii]|uniref:Uncharacterized protein n=1 Tax=Aquisphaera giovannonii TaxID=406548 RepID=A0A5B9W607_9BACT|nr:hypothetical protein [Aquisphaera giovannonii]QEH35654.1 hypothetical protein OJF2_42090 [Aquisphaera giovannonii]